MKFINAVLIRTNGLTVTFQSHSWKEAARRVLSVYDQSIYDHEHHGMAAVAKIFLADQDTEDMPEEYTADSLRDDLAAGRINN